MLQMNLHPFEKQILVADGLLTVVGLGAAIMLESTMLLVLVVVVSTVPYLVVQKVLPDRLGAWRRYSMWRADISRAGPR
jgi:hypothetical protein